jgi:hypothetical protein
LASFGRSQVAISHFDLVPYRSEYDTNLFAALRFMVMERRYLVLLVQSRTPFSALLPRGHPLSDIHLETVELKAYP